MPASLAVVTAAQGALLSNQFPPLYDAASGGPHHLTLTLRLVGFIRLVVILCVLRYLGCRPVVKLHSANIAAHISPHPVMGCYFMGGVGHCAAISGFWAASRARFARYRSTHLQDEVGFHVRPSLSDKYCAAILPVLGLDSASRVRYRSTHPGRGARDVRELGSSVQPGLSDK